jgi:two-component sensor histidine kinase
MKTTSLSFLFFCLVFLTHLPTKLKAQTQVDSTKLFYNAITNPQKSEIPIGKAIIYFENLRDHFLSERDTMLAVNCISFIAHGHFNQGHWFESEMSAIEGFKLLDKLDVNDKTKTYRMGLSNHMGMLHRKKNDFKGAIKFYERTLEFSTTLKDSLKAFNNISNVLIDEGNYLSAVSKLEYTFGKAKSLTNYPEKWRILDNWGYALFKLDIPDAINKMELALEMKLKENDLEGTFSSHLHFSDYYLHSKDTINAKLHIEKAKKTAKEIGSNAYFFEAISREISLNDNLNIQFFKKHIDSINQLEQQNDRKYAYRKYENEKLENDRIKANYKTNLWQMAGGVVILASIFLFFYYQQRNRIEKDRERHRTEQILSKKVHDEVGNDLFYLMTQVQSNPHEFLEKNGIKLLDGLNDIYGKARDISKHYTAVHTGPNYNDELLSLLNSFGSDKVKLIINKTEPNFWETIEANTKETIYRVLQELLTNMKKHSHANFVAITFSKDSKNIFVKYVDNGVGVDLNNLIHKNGLDNVESRMAAQKGSITFESTLNQGFKAFIKLSI